MEAGTEQQFQAEVMDQLKAEREEWEHDAEAQAEYNEYLADYRREEKLLRSVR